MEFVRNKKQNFPVWIIFLILLVLSHCSGLDEPLLLTPENDGSTGAETGGGEVVDPSTSPGVSEGCTVNFLGQLQLQVSSSGMAAILDSRFINIPPIPIQVSGNNLTISGSSFPEILPYLGENPPADLFIHGDPTNSGTGTYDPETGRMNIEGFKFIVDVKSGGASLGEPLTQIPPVRFTTDENQEATGNGDPSSITVSGVPLNKSDRSVTMVIAISLPAQLGGLDQVDERIGGGALTAVFKGNLDQLPESCVEGGGEPAGGSGSGGLVPSEFSVSDGTFDRLSEIDFGNTLVSVRNLNEKTVLDCLDATNRGVATKTLTIRNTGRGERKIKILKPQDSDSDRKDPLCTGDAEFVRGSLQILGGATCENVNVAGRDFIIGDCTIPEGQDNGISFPVMYVPFNYVAPAAGGDSTSATSNPAAEDTGNLLIEYDGGKYFSINLIGRSEADNRDSFSLSKVNNGVVSFRKIFDRGLINIPLRPEDPKPFTQKMVLQNSGTESYEQVTFAIAGENSAFSIPTPVNNLLGPSDGARPGTLEFDLVFNPGTETTYNDTLMITLTRAGSQSTLTINLSGTNGLPVLSGRVKFQIDYLTAKIDHPVTVDPIESSDFRLFPDQGPPPFDLIFEDTSDPAVKAVYLGLENKSVLDKTIEERKRSIRVFNAQATIGTNGRKLSPADGSDLCNEARDISIAYDDSRQECSYFYYNLFSETPGFYDDDSRNFTLPNITMRIQNPYHSDIAGRWLKSNPNTNPTNIMDTLVMTSLTTLQLSERTVQEGDQEIVLVPDERITKSQLNVKGKLLGNECPQDFLNRDPGVGTLTEKFPRLGCYLSSDGRYLQGTPVTLRPNQTKEYDIVLVGVGQFDPTDPNLPWFINEGSGSRFYIGIQARLIVGN